MKSLTPKASEIVESARALFWKHGINRVSVKEICRDASCSKMTFYRHFENKTDLAKTVLNQLAEEGRESYRAIMSRDIPFSDKIHGIVVLKSEKSKDISSEFVQDIISGDKSELKEHLHKMREKSNKDLLRDLKAAQKEGQIRSDLNIEFALLFSERLSIMLKDEELKTHFETTQDFIVELTNLFFYGIGAETRQ